MRPSRPRRQPARYWVGDSPGEPSVGYVEPGWLTLLSLLLMMPLAFAAFPLLRAGQTLGLLTMAAIVLLIVSTDRDSIWRAPQTHELERIDGRLALQTMCEGGGQANVTIIDQAVSRSE